MTKHGHAERPILSSTLTMTPEAPVCSELRPGEPAVRYVVRGSRDGEQKWIARRGAAWFVDGHGRIDDATFGPYESAEAALAALQRRENTQEVVRTCRCYRRTRITTVINPEVWPVKQPVVISCAACAGSIHALIEGQVVGAELVPKVERPRRHSRARTPGR